MLLQYWSTLELAQRRLAHATDCIGRALHVLQFGSFGGSKVLGEIVSLATNIGHAPCAAYTGARSLLVFLCDAHRIINPDPRDAI